MAVMQAEICVTQPAKAVMQSPEAVTHPGVMVAQTAMAVTRIPAAVAHAEVCIERPAIAGTQLRVAVTQPGVSASQTRMATTQTRAGVTRTGVAASAVTGPAHPGSTGLRARRGVRSDRRGASDLVDALTPAHCEPPPRRAPAAILSRLMKTPAPATVSGRRLLFGRGLFRRSLGG